MLDKMRIPHGLTQRGMSRLKKEADAARNEYSLKRNAAIDEYNNKVKDGKIRVPGTIEKLLKKSKGHSDNPSVQAARRSLKKRGIDWKTGKKL